MKVIIQLYEILLRGVLVVVLDQPVQKLTLVHYVWFWEDLALEELKGRLVLHRKVPRMLLEVIKHLVHKCVFVNNGNQLLEVVLVRHGSLLLLVIFNPFHQSHDGGVDV